MSTLSTANIQSKAANTPPVIKDLNGTECGQFCRAWINFDGSAATIGTGRNHFNCSAVTDNGIGDYTINFATDMPNTSYVPVFTSIARNDSAGGFTSPGVRSVGSVTAPNSSLTVSSVRMMHRPTSSNVDADMYGVAVFGG